MNLRSACGHGGAVTPEPCGTDTWCVQQSGHPAPHDGQQERCTCNPPYLGQDDDDGDRYYRDLYPPVPVVPASLLLDSDEWRERFAETGDEADKAAMLDAVEREFGEETR